MNDMDLGIEILELKVKGNEIRWSVSYSQSAQSNSAATLESGDEELKLTLLTRNTIKFLVDQLQLLAEMNRISQPHDLPHEEDITSALDNLIRILGEHLYRVLFKGRIQEHLNLALKESNLLRVELELEEAPELENWPWEFLYRPWDETTGSGEFIARSTQLVLSRRLYPAKPITARTPVKVLLVVSEPESVALSKVQCDKVLDAIRELKKEHVVDLSELIEKVVHSAEYEPTVTRKNFREHVKELQPNIIHFIGHGHRTREGGWVAFVKEGGEPDWVSDEQFAGLAAESKDLKLVFLQACESALSDPSSGSLSMAMQLAHRHIPAVVAMQYKIESEIANTFACGFYRALAKGLSVDLAVKAGRAAIDEELPGEPQRHAFGLPVVYLSSYESLFVQEKAHDIRPSDLFRGLPIQFPCPNPKCGALIALKSKVCTECGLHLYCSFCKIKFNNSLGNFCDECGEHLKCENCNKRYRDEKNSPFCRECRNRSSAGVEDASLMASTER